MPVPAVRHKRGDRSEAQGRGGECSWHRGEKFNPKRACEHKFVVTVCRMQMVMCVFHSGYGFGIRFAGASNVPDGPAIPGPKRTQDRPLPLPFSSPVSSNFGSSPFLAAPQAYPDCAQVAALRGREGGSIPELDALVSGLCRACPRCHPGARDVAVEKRRAFFRRRRYWGGRGTGRGSQRPRAIHSSGGARQERANGTGRNVHRRPVGDLCHAALVPGRAGKPNDQRRRSWMGCQTKQIRSPTPVRLRASGQRPDPGGK